MSEKAVQVVDEKTVEFEKATIIAKAVVEALATNTNILICDTMDNMTSNPAHANRIYLKWQTGEVDRFVIKTVESTKRHNYMKEYAETK